MALVIDSVMKKFGRFPALNGASLTAPQGAFVALVGPSGSGKTTLLRIMGGLEQADSGQVRFADINWLGLPARARKAGFVFQNYALFRHMNVAKNIAFGLEIRKRPKAEIKQRVADLISLVQLDGFGDRYPSQLSGGQRQRMALARALAVEPEVLLLDEPFGALDAKVRSELRAWLRRLHDEMHVTTVFVTHDQEEAMEVSDTIVLMDHGRIVQEGRPQDLYDHPENEFVMRFMGQVNQIGDAYVRPHDVEIRLEPNGTTEAAVVERVLHMGHHIRVDLTVNGGDPVSAQLTRDEAERLGLEPGRPVFVRPAKAKTFAGAPAEEAVEEPAG